MMTLTVEKLGGEYAIYTHLPVNGDAKHVARTVILKTEDGSISPDEGEARLFILIGMTIGPGLPPSYNEACLELRLSGRRQTVLKELN